MLERDVFIKVLNPQLAHDAEIRGRFEREAKAVARLDHPNLVRLYEYGQDADEGMYMLLEWVEGGNLSAHLKRRGRLTPSELESLARQLLAGLAALHSVGIVHRDLKPENVLVRMPPPAPPLKQGGEAISSPPLGPPMEWGEIGYKITDFSLAALRDAPGLTHHEAIVGTPAYMSPEQAAGGKISAQSDLFSLGVILYEAATGANPLIGETMLDTLRKIRESDISLEHSGILNLPVTLRKLIESLLRKSAHERPKSADSALRMIGDTAAPLKPQRHTRDLAYLALAVVVVGVLLIVVLRGKAENEKRKAGSGLVVRGDSVNASIPSQNTLKDEAGDKKETPPAPPLKQGGGELALKQGGEEVVTMQRGEITESMKVESSKSKIPPLTPLQSRGGESETQSTVVDSGLRSQVSSFPDSVELWLTTEPWAHIYVDGQRVSTTPMSTPLRLSGGNHSLELKNPAFPNLILPISLTEKTVRKEIHLADYFALLKVQVKPWGELYLDGEQIGTTPLTRPLFVAAGKHDVRLTHPSLPALEKSVSVAAGDTLEIGCNLTRSQWLANGAGK